jgi:16S rRNA processing protein RimM
VAAAADQTADWPDDAVEVGRIADAWGVKGWIKVQPFASQPQALIAAKRWFLRPADGVKRAGPAKPAPVALPSSLTISAARLHGDMVVASAVEIADRNAAEALKGLQVFVSRASFPKTESDEYYWVDLIGCEVRNRAGELLGTVTDLLDTGPHTVLRLAADDAEGGERLIPFVAAYVDDVDVAQRRITVDWGLDF